MATYTETINTNYNFPNLSVYNRYKDGVLCAYRVYPDDGYVMYDSSKHDTVLNPDTMEEEPVTYYCTMAGLPLNYNFNNFPWVAVLRSEVDENYIFGGGNEPEHEVM